MKLSAFFSRSKLRQAAEAHRKALAEADAHRDETLAPLKRAIANKDTRGIGERYPAARAATNAKLALENSQREDVRS